MSEAEVIVRLIGTILFVLACCGLAYMLYKTACGVIAWMSLVLYELKAIHAALVEDGDEEDEGPEPCSEVSEWTDGLDDD